MQLISSNLLPVPIDSDQDGSTPESSVEFGLEYCPSMDLIVVYPKYLISEDMNGAIDSAKSPAAADYAQGYGDDEELNVDVYRLNGQKVFTTTIEVDTPKIGITDVAWREDGIILAIATSDNHVRLVDTFSGKVVHKFASTGCHSPSGIKDDSNAHGAKRKSLTQAGGPRKRQRTPMLMHYSTHFSDPTSTNSRLAAMNKDTGRTLDDLMSLHADVDELLKLEADLPKELAGIDVEQYLPKLATLPASGTSEDAVFASRISIDSLFHTGKQNTKSRGTDIVAIAGNDANIHVRIFDSFEVGDIDLNSALKLPAGCILDKAKAIVTHPFLEKIFVLASEQTDSSTTRTRKQNKSEATDASRLHLLSLDLRFLQQSRLTLPTLATKATQLHNLARYLRQIEQQLTREAKSAFDLPSRFIRTLEEDLKEQDGDGSTFQTSAYHALLTGEVTGKFKEWLVDILGDRGVKRWEKAVSECLENARRLMNESWVPAVERAGVVVSRLIGLAASGTFRVDKAISDGLRDTIDVMGIIGEDLIREVNVEITGFSAFMGWLKKEVEAASLEDTSEKLEEMRENSNHADIRKVLKYISERVQDTAVKKYIRDEPGKAGGDEDAVDDLSFYQEFCKAHKSTKKPYTPPTIKQLTDRLRVQCDRLFQQVAQQLEENIVVEHVCPLNSSWNTEVMACRVLYQQEDPALIMFIIDSESQGIAWVAQISLGQAKHHTKMTKIALGGDLRILDISIVDDETALVLVQTKETTKVLGIGLQNGFEVESTPRHTFGGGEDNFTKLGLSPWKMNVNGRKGRRTMTILDKQGRGYGVYDLDSAANGGRAGDETMSL